MEKLELQAQLKAIEEQELKEKIAQNYPDFKKLEGKCFKYKNSFGGVEKPSDYWWMYTKVTEIKESDIYTSGENVLCSYTGFTFQTDKYKQITINPNEIGYVHSLQDEISEKEFNRAWSRMIANINSINPTKE